MKKILIGIDPDVTASGFAKKEGKEITLKNLSFFELFDEIKSHEDMECGVLVYIECGFLNKGNWHKTTGSNSVNAQIGQRTGANHETAKKIIEMCEYLKVPYVEIKPTRSKVDSKFFQQITGLKQRTNQEQRDAYMLIHGK